MPSRDLLLPVGIEPQGPQDLRSLGPSLVVTVQNRAPARWCFSGSSPCWPSRPGLASCAAAVQPLGEDGSGRPPSLPRETPIAVTAPVRPLPISAGRGERAGVKGVSTQDCPITGRRTRFFVFFVSLVYATGMHALFKKADELSRRAFGTIRASDEFCPAPIRLRRTLD